MYYMHDCGSDHGVNGHVNIDTLCSGCFARTMYALLVE